MKLPVVPSYILRIDTWNRPNLRQVTSREWLDQRDLVPDDKAIGPCEIHAGEESLRRPELSISVAGKGI